MSKAALCPLIYPYCQKTESLMRTEGFDVSHLPPPDPFCWTEMGPRHLNSLYLTFPLHQMGMLNVVPRSQGYENSADLSLPDTELVSP